MNTNKQRCYKVSTRVRTGSIAVSGQLPTHPSPNLTLILACYKLEMNFVRLSHGRVTYDVDRDVSTANCQSSSDDEVDCLRVAIYSTLVRFYWCISILIIIPIVGWCSLIGPHKSALVLYDRGYPSFDFAIPVDVVGMKSYMDSLFDLTCVPVGVTINKLHKSTRYIGNMSILRRNSRDRQFVQVLSLSGQQDLFICFKCHRSNNIMIVKILMIIKIVRIINTIVLIISHLQRF